MPGHSTALESDELRAAVAARLRRSGQRATPTRDALVQVLLRAGRPLTIPEILDSGAGIAQSSAYRNLQLLEQAGVVHRIVTNAEFARYELAEDLTGDHHHHLICSSCGSVEDVPASAGLERSLHAAIDQVAATTGFQTAAHRIDLVGLCRDCA
jgi:Fur family ferric uptake transcriptional regulator